MRFSIKIFILIGLMMGVCSCTWEKDSLVDGYDIFYIERNKAQIPVHIHGNFEGGVFILILHGGPGGNGLQYRPGVFAEVIEKNYAVAYLDQRGQGMSQGHLSSDLIDVDQMVDDVRAITAVIKHKYGANSSLFLLGHSWGGTLGSAYLSTKDYQNEFKGWIEVDGAHDFDLLLKSQVRLVNLVGKQELGLDRDTEFWTEFIEQANEVDTVNYVGDDIVQLNGLAYDGEENLFNAKVIRDGTTDYLNAGVLTKSLLFSNNPLTSFISGAFTSLVLFNEKELLKANFSQNLSNINIPTLLLWGKYDLVVPAELGEQALREISSVKKRLVIFEESGHSPMSSEGVKFGEEVIRFIEEFK